MNEEPSNPEESEFEEFTEVVGTKPRISIQDTLLNIIKLHPNDHSGQIKAMLKFLRENPVSYE